MSLQTPCMGGCKVTLVAFVLLFVTVHFQMRPQMACMRWGIVALVALVWLFSFIICVYERNIFSDTTFTRVNICKILIHHHHQVGDVVSCVMSLSNWENEDCGSEERKMKVRVIARMLKTIWQQDHQPQKRQRQKIQVGSNKLGVLNILTVKSSLVCLFSVNFINSRLLYKSPNNNFIGLVLVWLFTHMVECTMN